MSERMPGQRRRETGRPANNRAENIAPEITRGESGRRTDGTVEFAPEVIRASVDPAPPEVVRRAGTLGGNAAALRAAHALGFAAGDLAADAYTGEEPPDFFFGALVDLDAPIPDPDHQDRSPVAHAGTNRTVSSAPASPGGGVVPAPGRPAEQSSAPRPSAADPAIVEQGTQVLPGADAATADAATGSRRQGGRAPATGRVPPGAADASGATGTPPATAVGRAAVNSPDELVTAVSTAAGNLTSERHSVAEPPDVAAGRAFPAALAAPMPRPATGIGRGAVGSRRPTRQDDLPPDPVPAATKAITTAREVPLPELPLPPLLTPPGGPTPILVFPPGIARLKRPKPPEPEKTKAKKPGPGAKTAAQESEQDQTVAPQPAAPQPFVPPVLLDLRQPPMPVLDPTLKSAEQSKIRRVIASVKADLPAAAKAFVPALRNTAGFGGLLSEQYLNENVAGFWEPAIGDKQLLDRLIEPMRRKLDELGEAAGLSASILEQAVREKQQEMVGSGRAVSDQTRALIQQRGSVIIGDAEKQAAKEQAQLAKEHAQRLTQLRRAMTSRDPALVTQLADERVMIMNDHVAAGILALESSATRRFELLEALTAAYLEAYDVADDTAQAAARASAAKAASPASPPSVVQVPRTPDGRPWLLWAREQTVASMKALRTQTIMDRDTRIGALRAVGTAGAAAVRDWADKRLRRNASQQDQEAQAVADRTAAEQRLKQASKQAAQNQARDDLVAQLRYAEAFHAARQAEATGTATADQKKMLAEGGKMADAYLGSAEVAGDPLSAVAHHLMEQVGSQIVVTLAESGDVAAEVKKLRPHTQAQALSLGRVIFGSRPPDARSRVASLSAATRDKYGTDEDAVFAALDNLDKQQVATIAMLYETTYDETLYDRLDSELSGSEWGRAKALLGSDQVGAAAAVIREETNSFFGRPDQAKIAAAIKTLPPGTGRELKEKFGESARWYNDSSASLDEVLDDSLRDYRYDQRTGQTTADDRGSEQIGLLLQVNMLKKPEPAPAVPGRPKVRPSVIDSQDTQNQIDALQAKADAIELDQALRPASGPAKADAVDGVFSRMRAEIADANPAWTAEQVNNEARRRNASVELKYGQRFPAAVQTNNFGLPVENLKPEDSKLRQVMAANLYDSGEHEIGTAMLDVDRRAERTARLLLADRGAYAADSDVNAALDASYTQAADEVRRSEGPRLRDERAVKVKKAQDNGHPMTADQLADEDRKLDRELERLIDLRAKKLMDETTQHWSKTGRGSLDKWVKDKTQGSGETEATWRLDQGGRLTRAQELKFAVDGWGIDIDRAKKALAGRTPQEISDIAKDFAKISDNEDLTERLHSETSGENRFDIDEALRGEPLTAEERMAALTRRYEYNKNTYFWGSGPPKSLSGSMSLLEAEYQEAKESYKRLKDPSATLTVEDRNFLQRSFEAQAARTEAGAAEYRAAVHAYTDEWVQIISTAVAVVVGGALAVATGGAALPLVALAASLWGTAATMVVKLVLLGEAYGVHEYVDDLVVGAVDAAFAFATAGLGDKLLGVAKVSGADRAALRLAAAAVRAQRAAKPLIARMGASLVENVAGAAPSALAGNLVNRDNWRGDMFANVAKGTFMQIGTGLAVGGVVGHSLEMGGRVFGAIAGPALEKLKASRAAASVPESGLKAAGAGEHEHVPGSPPAARTGEVPHVAEHLETGGSPEARPDVARAETTTIAGGTGLRHAPRESGPGSAVRGPAGEETGRRSGPAPDASESARTQAEFDPTKPDMAGVRAAEQPKPAASDVPVESVRTGGPTIDATGAPLARIESHPDAVHQQQRAMRREVLADIPPRERAAYAATPVLVLSDVEYTARTGSAEKGMATVLIIGGKPVVVIREGAPLWALREEGRHLKQLADPIHAEHLRLLDERRLEDWKNLPLSERMLSAQAHLELEIAAQRELIADLSHLRLAGSGEPHLDVRLDTAARSHVALTGRLAELESFRASPEGSPPPRFLDDPSRLNTKKTSLKPPPNAPPDPAAVPSAAEAQAAASAIAKADAELAAARVQRDQALEERKAFGADLKRVTDFYNELVKLEGEIFKSKDGQARAALDLRRRQVLADFAASYPAAGKNLALARTVNAVDSEAVARHLLTNARDLLRSRSVELSQTVRRLDHLLSGSKLKLGEPTAGAWSKVDPQGGDRHHIPSWDALRRAFGLGTLPDSPLLTRSGGGVIRMDDADHGLTASHGSAYPAGKFRDEQVRFIAEGKYLDAVKMDIEEIRGNPKLAPKYEKEIQALLDFLTKNKAEVNKLSPNSTITIESLRTSGTVTP
ncbi:hypothetical protein [Arthrobacter humicola]